MAISLALDSCCRNSSIYRRNQPLFLVIRLVELVAYAVLISLALYVLTTRKDVISRELSYALLSLIPLGGCAERIRCKQRNVAIGVCYLRDYDQRFGGEADAWSRVAQQPFAYQPNLPPSALVALDNRPPGQAYRLAAAGHRVAPPPPQPIPQPVAAPKAVASPPALDEPPSYDQLQRDAEIERRKVVQKELRLERLENDIIRQCTVHFTPSDLNNLVNEYFEILHPGLLSNPKYRDAITGVSGSFYPNYKYEAQGIYILLNAGSIFAQTFFHDESWERQEAFMATLYHIRMRLGVDEIPFHLSNNILQKARSLKVSEAHIANSSIRLCGFLMQRRGMDIYNIRRRA